MLCEVVQYIRPNGRKAEQTVELDDSLQENYTRMQERGFRFAAEVLTTGNVALSVENDEEDLDIRLTPNEPGIAVEVYETMLQRHFSR